MHGVSIKTPSSICPVPLREGLPIPEPCDSFSLDCDEEKENAHKNTPATTYVKRSGIFPEHNLCLSTQDHAEKTS
jgi:hypothetical protein